MLETSADLSLDGFKNPTLVLFNLLSPTVTFMCFYYISILEQVCFMIECSFLLKKRILTYKPFKDLLNDFLFCNNLSHHMLLSVKLEEVSPLFPYYVSIIKCMFFLKKIC